MESLDFLLWKRKKRKEFEKDEKERGNINPDISQVQAKPQEIAHEEKHQEKKQEESKSHNTQSSIEAIVYKLDKGFDDLKIILERIETTQSNTDIINRLEEIEKNVKTVMEKMENMEKAIGIKPGGKIDMGTLMEGAPLTKRLSEVLEIIRAESTVTPTTLSKKLGCKTSTSCEFLKKLVKIGKIKEIKRGVYKVEAAG